MIRIYPDNGGDKMLYGAKVLGSYVGSADRLEKKLAELKKEADAITMVNSLQIQYLLLRWCFCQKIIHLQRTIPPNLIGTHLEPGFTELKKLILNSILGRADGIPPKTFDLAELHIQDSGIGLFNSADTSKAAFLASFVKCASVSASEVSIEDSELNTGMVYELTRQYGWPLVGLRSQVRDAQDRQR